MKVDTIIIGAGRSGTTSLYTYLNAHPQVCFSITKELHYFSLPDLYARGEKYLHSLFTCSGQKCIATADTYLLTDADAPEKVKAYNAHMRILIMLRDPVERAYSNYSYSVNFGHEEKGVAFLDTLAREKDLLPVADIVTQNNLCHFYGSLYHKHISVWNAAFPKEQLYIYTLSDLKKDPEAFYKKLCADLEISYVPSKNTDAANKASGVKSKWLQQFLLNRNNPVRKVFSFILRPFRTIIIRSGVIDTVYAMNKAKNTIPPISDDEKNKASKYFTEDLNLLESDYGIFFPE